MSNEYIRARGITHAFRTTQEEANEIDLLVRASGLTKQEYLYNKATDKDIKIIHTPRVNNLLRNEVRKLIDELSKLSIENLSEDVLNRIELIIQLYCNVDKNIKKG